MTHFGFAKYGRADSHAWSTVRPSSLVLKQLALELGSSLIIDVTIAALARRADPKRCGGARESVTALRRVTDSRVGSLTGMTAACPMPKPGPYSTVPISTASLSEGGAKIPMPPPVFRGFGRSGIG